MPICSSALLESPKVTESHNLAEKIGSITLQLLQIYESNYMRGRPLHRGCREGDCTHPVY